MKEKWWHDLVGYQIYPKSFQDSNRDGIGDIPGIIRRLDYLKELGINMIWVCPIYRSPMMDHGYDISDYTRVDPMFGTNEDLRLLIGEAAKRGITVIMDLVINHTSSQHPWFLKALEDPEGEYGRYYIIRKSANGQPPNNWRSLFGGSAWERIGESDYFYLHLFTVGQPDLNWENEALRQELYRMINGWLEMGIGGFRIDAISHIKKDLSCQNEPADGPDGLNKGMRYFRNVEGIEDYLRELKENTFQRYDCFTLAEADDIPEDRIEEYIGGDGYFSTVFDFCHCHHNLRDGSWEGRGEEMRLDIRNLVFARQKKMNGKGFFCNYQENHDMIRVPDRFLEKRDQNFYSLSMLPVLYFYLAGIPMIYQGQEIGMTDFDRTRIEEYADLATFNAYEGYLQKGLTKEQALWRINCTSREQSRTPMQWSADENGGFTEGKPWFALNPDYKTCNVENQLADDSSLLHFFRKVIALRQNSRYQKTWIYGSFQPLEEESKQLWSFGRCLDGQELLVFANLTGKSARTQGSYPGRVLLNNYAQLTQTDGHLVLEPWQAVVLEGETHEFAKRFAKHERELKETYLSLYGNEAEYEQLLSGMKEYYEARSEELKSLDREREGNPTWYREGNMLGMTMYPKLFAGGLKGLTEKLDYLSEQGITYLHLMPLLKMPHPYNDGGYAVEDFHTVDPEIGTNEELAALTGALRRRGISLCLDMVMNHTADTHEWAMRAKAGEQAYIDRYQCYDTYDIPAEFEKTMPQVFPSTAPGNFTWCEDMKKYVLTTFYPYQWDLNYHNPVVFNEMAANILFLANLGVEVVRIDAVPYIWKELGTTCRNLPQVHTIVRLVRMILEVVCPAVILKGEVVMAPRELPPYFGTPEKPECHMLYGATTMVNLWAALATRDTRLLKHQMDVIHSLPDNCYFVNYLRCHDDIGWGLDEEQEKNLMIDPLLHKEYLYHFFEGVFPGSFARGELYNFDPVTRDARSCGTTASLCGIEKGGFEKDPEQVAWGIRRVLLMHAACMSLEGFLMLSSGDEIGQVNDYSYKENPDIAADSRYLHRSPFRWEDAARRTEEGSVQHAIWEGLGQMEELRRTHTCFGRDADVTTWDTGRMPVFAIRRTTADAELVCLANFSEEEQVACLPILYARYEDIFTKERVCLQYVKLAPYQYRWCERVQ